MKSIALMALVAALLGSCASVPDKALSQKVVTNPIVDANFPYPATFLASDNRWPPRADPRVGG